MPQKTFWTAFWIIVLIATSLRLYNYFEIPYTHDEYSAINRTQFESFSEVIEKGVMVEGHPAGVQVFMYGYVKLFGSEPWIVRIPFLLLGILSVVLIILIGRKVGNDYTGLIAGAFAAVSQYFLFYSLVARPYSPGLFFVLAAMFTLMTIIKAPKNVIWHWIVYGICLAATPYIHYFAAFTAFVLYTLGLFFMPKAKVKTYILTGFGSLLLFLPHLDLFYKQFSMKGIGDWLPVPEWDFLSYYFNYSFHFSKAYSLIFIVLFITSAYFVVKERRWILLMFPSIWLIVYFTAFFYSRHVSSVLQVSTMLFAIPGVLLFSGNAFIRTKGSLFPLAIVALILVTGLTTLIYNRDHYNVMRNGLFKKSVETLCAQSEENGHDGVLFVSNHGYIPAMLGAEKCSGEVIFTPPGSLVELHEKLNDGRFSFVGIMINGTLSGALSMIKSHFPCHILANKYDRGEFHYFSRVGKNVQNEWDTIVQKRFNYSGNGEFLDIAKLDLDSIKMNSWSEIDIVLRFKPDSISDDLMVVSDLWIDEERVDWRGTKASQCGFDADGVRTIHHSIPFMDIHHDHKLLTLKTYVYNPQRNHFQAIEGLVMVRKANRLRYSLYDQIPED